MKTINLREAYQLARSLPYGQFEQEIKSMLTGQPCTVKIEATPVVTIGDDEWVGVGKPPVAWEDGDWYGKRTDFMLVELENGQHEVARAYVGFIDGSDFCDWYDTDDFCLTGVVKWKSIERLSPPKQEGGEG